MTDPAAPTTEAGQRLHERLVMMFRAWERLAKQNSIHVPTIEDPTGFILAIKAEARSTPAEPLDVERLAARLLEGQKRQGGSVPLADESEARAYAAWLLGASDEEAAEYVRLRSQENDR